MDINLVQARLRQELAKAEQANAPDAADWIYCRDDKWRPVKPGTFPLVAKLPGELGRVRDQGAPINPDDSSEARVMRLRGYGNAICVQVAAEVISAFLETEHP